MERNVLKERLMNKDDKNRHFVILIIDISKHGTQEMGHVKMANGRWKNIARENRICPLCNNGEIGDEFHYLFKCPAILT
jgi:hypothetical protein